MDCGAQAFPKIPNVWCPNLKKLQETCKIYFAHPGIIRANMLWVVLNFVIFGTHVHFRGHTVRYSIKLRVSPHIIALHPVTSKALLTIFQWTVLFMGHTYQCNLHYLNCCSIYCIAVQGSLHYQTLTTVMSSRVRRRLQFNKIFCPYHCMFYWPLPEAPEATSSKSCLLSFIILWGSGVCCKIFQSPLAFKVKPVRSSRYGHKRSLFHRTGNWCHKRWLPWALKINFSLDCELVQISLSTALFASCPAWNAPSDDYRFQGNLLFQMSKFLLYCSRWIVLDRK